MKQWSFFVQKMRSKPDKSDELTAALAEIITPARATNGRHQLRHRPRPARPRFVHRDRDLRRRCRSRTTGVSSGGAQGHGDVSGVAGGAARANDLRRVARPDARLNSRPSDARPTCPSGRAGALVRVASAPDAAATSSTRSRSVAGALSSHAPPTALGRLRRKRRSLARRCESSRGRRRPRAHRASARQIADHGEAHRASVYAQDASRISRRAGESGRSTRRCRSLRTSDTKVSTDTIVQ